MAKNYARGIWEGSPKLIATKLAHINTDKEQRQNMGYNITENWDYLSRECFGKVPLPKTIKDMMERINAVYHPAEIGIDKDTFYNSFKVAKDIRVRYGALQLLEDLGVMEDALDYIISCYY